MYVHQHSQLRLHAPLYKIKKIRVYVSCTYTVHLTATYSIIYGTDSFSQNIQENSAPLLIWTQYKNTLSAVNLSCALFCPISDRLQHYAPSPTPHFASDNSGSGLNHTFMSKHLCRFMLNIWHWPVLTEQYLILGAWSACNKPNNLILGAWSRSVGEMCQTAPTLQQ